jgi:hypothetical protein
VGWISADPRQHSYSWFRDPSKLMTIFFFSRLLRVFKRGLLFNEMRGQSPSTEEWIERALTPIQSPHSSPFPRSLYRQLDMADAHIGTAAVWQGTHGPWSRWRDRYPGPPSECRTASEGRTLDHWPSSLPNIITYITDTVDCMCWAVTRVLQFLWCRETLNKISFCFKLRGMFTLISQR